MFSQSGSIPKIIFAIDPGNIQSAYVIWNIDTEEIVDCGLIPNDKMLDKLHDNNINEEESSLYIEKIASYGMPVGYEVFDTCIWIGRFTQHWISLTAEEPTLVERRDIKLGLCNSTAARDSNIIQVLKDRYGDPNTKNRKGTKLNPGKLYSVNKDIWQALALAVYISDAFKSFSPCFELR
jgi:hypothetical protein